MRGREDRLREGGRERERRQVKKGRGGRRKGEGEGGRERELLPTATTILAPLIIDSVPFLALY